MRLPRELVEMLADEHADQRTRDAAEIVLRVVANALGASWRSPGTLEARMREREEVRLLDLASTIRDVATETQRKARAADLLSALLREDPAADEDLAPRTIRALAVHDERFSKLDDVDEVLTAVRAERAKRHPSSVNLAVSCSSCAAKMSLGTA